MNSLFPLQIPKRTSHCSHKGERLVPGMEIYSLLLENETQAFGRHDYCSTCWTILQEEGKKLETSMYWKSKIEYRKSSVESTRISRALKLLRDLQQEQEPKEAEIFVLCLFLSHARQIALRQEFKKEDVAYQLYEILRQEEFFTIKVLNLSQIQIETIQKSLADQLKPSTEIPYKKKIEC